MMGYYKLFYKNRYVALLMSQHAATLAVFSYLLLHLLEDSFQRIISRIFCETVSVLCAEEHTQRCRHSVFISNKL